MIHLVFGNHHERKTFITSLIDRANLETSSVVHLYPDDLGGETLFTDIVRAETDLFGGQTAYVIHDLVRILSLCEILPLYVGSQNIIIFSEDTVTKPIRTEFEKNDAVISELASERKKDDSSFNLFSLADALGERDKKKLWLGYQAGLRTGSVEEITGILLWQIKNMIMVFDSPSGVSGMKPFVFTKNQRYIKNYTREEVLDLAYRLTKAFHSRDRFRSLEVQVEEILLSI